MATKKDDGANAPTKDEITIPNSNGKKADVIKTVDTGQALHYYYEVKGSKYPLQRIIEMKPVTTGK